MNFIISQGHQKADRLRLMQDKLQREVIYDLNYRLTRITEPRNVHVHDLGVAFFIDVWDESARLCIAVAYLEIAI